MIEHDFKTTFESSPEQSLFTPGRVNLIGEHTDYNGGMVLPTAIELGPRIALSPRNDDLVRIKSESFDDLIIRPLTDTPDDHWSDYIIGAVQFARKADMLSGGADIYVQTTLPFGAGLSSSAAIIVGILKISRTLSGKNISDTEIAVTARQVENEYIGMPCGIMDQMAVAVAYPGQALALDTDKLTFDLIALPETHHMAVIHSGKYRRLSEGRYKMRKEECDVVKEALGREDICKISENELQSLSQLPDEIQRRARHCMTEHRRVVAAAAALTAADMPHFGKLMNESHVSMRDDFEITLPEIDALVEDAVSLGAVGARMTGGGFGGCIVACVPKTALETWKTDLLSQHPEAFYVV